MVDLTSPDNRFASKGFLIAAAVLTLGLALTFKAPLMAALGLHGMKDRAIVVGVLSHAAVAEPSLTGFKAEMERLGYREGIEITYLYHGAIADRAALAAEAEALANHPVDLFLGLTTSSSQAAQKAAEKAGIPVIFSPASNPLSAGLIDTISQPGHNTTGIMFAQQEGRRLEWLRLIAPQVKRIYLPYTANDPSPTSALPTFREAAQQLGLELVLRPVADLDDVERAIADVPGDVQAIVIPADAQLSNPTEAWINVALPRKLALTFPHQQGTTEGGLFSFGINLPNVGRQAARLAQQILSGTPAGDIPVETAEFDLTINQTTAEAIGLDISPDILRQAVLIR